MSASQAPGIDDLLPILTHDVIEAVADRPRESDARRSLRAEAARCLIESFECEDGVEIMLAGNLVLMRSVMLDSHHDSRHAPTLDGAYRHRQQTLMTMRLQLSTLDKIDHQRAGRPPVMAEMAAVETAPPQVVAESIAVPAPEPEEEIAPEPLVEPVAMEAVQEPSEEAADIATLSEGPLSALFRTLPRTPPSTANSAEMRPASALAET